MEKINFDWPLDQLRSETVKVYVNNEINILVSISEPSKVSTLIQNVLWFKNSFVNLGMSSFFVLNIQLLLLNWYFLLFRNHSGTKTTKTFI